MQYQASFDEKATVSWDERPSKPIDLSRLQGFMFPDRPDLWIPVKKPGRARPRALPRQPELKIEEIQKGVIDGRETC